MHCVRVIARSQGAEEARSTEPQSSRDQSSSPDGPVPPRRSEAEPQPSREQGGGPAPPRRRSPVARGFDAAPDASGEPEERDYFIPILVMVSLAGYAITVLIAWLEYQ